MLSVENIDTWGFENAIRAMRNPMNSWDKSDSQICYGIGFTDCTSSAYHCPRKDDLFEHDIYCIGNADMELMQKLFKAGTEHRTYARMIYVAMDITAPLYWWKEMDRYTVGKSQVSCSTMHRIASKEFTPDDFSTDHLLQLSKDALYGTISVLNTYRKDYNETKNKEYWWQMIQLLPSSYNQKRTICMSYETVFKIIKERTGHKLDEWNDFVNILKQLPYVEDIINEQ